MKAILGAILFFVFASANAALVDRGEGFIYDDVLDITWAQNANLNGLASWEEQTAWADGYSQTHSVFGNFDDWRLPSLDRNGDGQFALCQSFNVSEVECRDTEFGYLYYQNGISLASPGVFTDIQLNNYWASNVQVGDPVIAAGFEFLSGQSIGDFKSSQFGSWAVRDGDIVPVPAAVWLFGSALMGLGWMRRR
jgi:hypothetical protein